MSSDFDFFSGGDIPSGDKIRFGALTSVAASGSDTTVLTVASGGGILHGLWAEATAGNVQWDHIKVTVDGASERTLSLSNGGNRFAAMTTSAGSAFNAALPIKFNTSLTVKVGGTTGAAAVEVVAVYSVK